MESFGKWEEECPDPPLLLLNDKETKTIVSLISIFFGINLAITFFLQQIESGPHNNKYLSRKELLNEIRLVVIGHWVKIPYIFGHPPLHI